MSALKSNEKDKIYGHIDQIINVICGAEDRLDGENDPQNHWLRLTWLTEQFRNLYHKVEDTD